ncbi:hypothetical protein ASE69_20260 [Sphingomonas sp. Leaf208]|uniref:Ig-like domain-containing protein n=1 Tax=Sphingomonas sp. Leaf208 TaxID=1735679 RepID=UPI0006F2012D|nr:Ig-like domain-containing protein [Sphingomonas sp. Leaf208]KQM51966.1 hypothetical protein ASE69_20260 [Sphingomonas sp. Leaf208]
MIEEVLGNEVFLQGKYISLGINSSGTLGTKQTAPDSVYTDSINGFIRLGMVADVDGFGTGKAATRETMLTGTPQEGFSLGYDIGSSHYVRTNAERTSMRQIADGATSAQSTDNTMTATWNGTTAEKVKIDQVMSLADDAKFVRVDITLTNQTGSAMENVRYMRTIDPDHGPSFTTINTIVEQGGDGADGALIAAYAGKGTTPFFYYSADDRAKVSTYGLKNYDPYAAAAYTTAQSEGFSKEADESININFDVGTLAAGAKTTITFYFGITDNLNTTISAIKSHDASTSTPPPVLVPINHAPTVANDSASTTGTAPATGNVLTNDKDGDGDALTATLVKGPTHGTLTLATDGNYR